MRNNNIGNAPHLGVAGCERLLLPRRALGNGFKHDCKGERFMDGEAVAESDRSIVGNPMLLPFYDLSFDEIELLCRVTADQQDDPATAVDGAWFASFMGARKEPAR
jgi:hypothetical protein